MKLQELNKWLEELFNIIVDLNISINNARYLIKEEGSETVESIKKTGFFNHHIYQLKFITVVQLCKIFDNRNNQKRNIYKLFNKLRNEGYDTDLKELLSNNQESDIGLKNKHDIIQSINYLEQQINKEKKTIEKIVSLRDCVFAHSDPNNTYEDIYWNELETLIKLSNKFYNEIYGKLYNCDTRFEITLDWEARNIIESFAWYKDLNKRKKASS